MNNARLHRFPPKADPPTAEKKQISQIIILVTGFWLLVTLVGCDAFVRKFTRKPKRENLPKEEMVLEPEEYRAPEMTKEELYRQYWLFWKSWHDELIASLSQGANHKKQLDCVNEILKNLKQLRTLLNPQMQKKLDIYIGQTEGLRDSIAKDIYGSGVNRLRNIAERIRMNILRDFSYNRIKDYLV